MNVFSRRPLVVMIAFCLLLSLIAALVGKIGIIVISLIVILAAVCAVIYIKRNPTGSFFGMRASSFVIVLGVLILLVLADCFVLYGIVLSRFENLIGQAPTELQAVVIDVRYESGWSSTYEIKAESADGRSAFYKGLLVCSQNPGLVPGDRITCRAGYISLDELYSDYDLSKFDLIASGIRFAAELDGEIERVGKTVSPSIILSNLRKEIKSAICLFADNETADLVSGLMLSDRDNLDLLQRDMRRIGASHLIALSGLHLTLLCSFVELILKLFRVKPLLRKVIALFSAVGFMFLAGCPYSLVRAVIMLVIMSGLSLFGRDRDRMTSLFAAVFIIILIDPASIFDVGLQLSFCATLGMIIFGGLFEDELDSEIRFFFWRIKGGKLLLSVIEMIVISFGAVMFVLPLQWLYFGETSLLSIPSTLLFHPLIGIIIWTAIPYQLSALVGLGELALVFGKLLSAMSWILRSLASSMSRLPTMVSLNYFFTPIIMAAFAVCVVIIAHRRKRVLLRVVLAFSCMGILFLSLVGMTEIRRSLTDELYGVERKTNDSLIIYSDRRCMLVDISDGSSSIIRASLKCMKENNITEIDSYLLTHLHRAHIRSLQKLSESIMLRRIILPLPEDENDAQYAKDLESLAEKYDIRVEYYSRPESVLTRFGSVELTLYESAKLSRSTHPLIGLRVELGDRVIAYLGSSVWEDESFLEFFSEADTYLIGRHGPVEKTPLPPLPNVTETLPVDGFFSEKQ